MLTLALLLSPPALQAPPPGPRPAPVPLLRHARELGLTEAQKAQIQALHEARRSAMETRETALREAQEALMTCVRTGKGDLNALHRVFSERHLAMLTERKALHAEVLAVLNSEQQAKVQTLQPRGPRGRGPRHGGWGPPVE